MLMKADESFARSQHWSETPFRAIHEWIHKTQIAKMSICFEMIIGKLPS